MKRILIAGIGNVFRGDDAFGVEVVRELSRHRLPEEVCVKDFGIRSEDLACALNEGYDLVVFVDAAPHGVAAGTVFLIEPDLDQIASLPAETMNPHDLDPVRVLQMAKTFGGKMGRLYLVGCEPAELATHEDGRLGLTAPVQAAIPDAVEMLRSLVAEFLEENKNKEPSYRAFVS